MFANLTGWHLLVLVAVLLLLFGAARLPALAKGVGQSVRILRHETSGPEEGDDGDEHTEPKPRRRGGKSARAVKDPPPE